MNLIIRFVWRSYVRCLPPGQLAKTVRIMKCTAFLLLAFCLQLSARTVSQTVSLSVKNEPLTKVLGMVKKQTGYSIIWDESLLKSATPVTLEVKKMPLDDVIDLLLKEQHLTYKIVGKLVLINKKIAADPESPDSDLPPPPFTVSGKILDQSGKPIAGASIMVKGSKTGTVSENDGSFKLELKKNEEEITLVVTSQGYEKKEVKVKNGQQISINLQKAEKKLDEVVISNGIFSKRKESYTGAVTVVTAAELAMHGNRNILTSLRNIDPSFNIIESNNWGSDPNRLPEIQIRGNSSLPNVNELKDEVRVNINTPLVIIDGFESTMRRLLDLNQNEVELVTLLKDASATAIYGSRGANGVIVITTKLPVAGKLRLSYRADAMIEAPDISSYNLLKAKDKLELEYIAGLYNHYKADQDIILKRYYNYLLNEVNRGVETDWLSKPLRTGIGQRHNLRMEGGDKSFRYSISAQYNGNEGVMKESYRRTFNGTIDLSYYYKNIRFTNNLMIGTGNTRNSPYGNFGDYAKLNPYWAPYNSQGKLNRVLGDPGENISGGRWFTLPGNPLYNATLSSFDKTNNTDIINNFIAEIRVNPDFIITARLGLTKETQESDNFISPENTNFNTIDLLRRGSYSYTIAKAFRYDAAVNLKYNRQFNKHALFAGVEYNIRQDDYRSYAFRAEGFSNPNFDFISMALQYEQGGKPSGSESLKRSLGIAANVSYGFDDQRYFVDLQARTDGSSQFGELNRFAPFWSAGLGWNLHKEKGLQYSKTIDVLRLRGSTGITGTQNFNAYQALQTYRYYSSDKYYNWLGAYLLDLGTVPIPAAELLNIY